MNTIENLRKLADYIEANVPQEQLIMEHFRSDKSGKQARFKSAHDCGTSGCALGHAPFVPGLEVVAEDYIIKDDLAFFIYSRRIFPGLKEEEGDLWEECFGQEQSSDKAEVVRRLRETADHLEAKQ